MGFPSHSIRSWAARIRAGNLPRLSHGRCNLGAVSAGTVSVRADPAFVDPDAGDYHIGPGSAATNTGVDAGVNDDIDGGPRPDGCFFDIGADELITGRPCHRTYLPLVLRNGP